MGRIIDTTLWISRRLRLAVLALLVVAAVKTAAAAVDRDPVAAGADAPIISAEGVVSSRHDDDAASSVPETLETSSLIAPTAGGS